MYGRKESVPEQKRTYSCSPKSGLGFLVELMDILLELYCLLLYYIDNLDSTDNNVRLE